MAKTKEAKTLVLKPKTNNQSNYIQAMAEHDVTFCTGPAGTGKTAVAIGLACEYLRDGKVENIKIVRPAIETCEGGGLGYLPGELDKKLNPYFVNIKEELIKYLGRSLLGNYFADGTIEIASLEYMRGRAETLDSPIITPDGIKLMGEIKVGDKVIGSNGKSINVIGIFPQGKKQIYKVQFADHTFVKCSEDHLWNTMTLSEKNHKKGYTAKTTKIIKESLKTNFGQKRHCIPMLDGAVEFNKQTIDIDPYLLGLLLGDGHIRTGGVRICSNDEEIIQEVQKRIPNELQLKHRKLLDYAIVSKNNKN